MLKFLATLFTVFAAFILVAATVALVILIPALLVFWLYNACFAPVFHTPHIGFLTTFGLLWLFSIVINFFRK